MRTILSAIVILIMFTGTTHAKLYKWVDENGVTHFSNVAPPSDQEHQVKEEAKSKSRSTPRSPGMDQVINSYKMDAIEDGSTTADRKYDRNKKEINKEYAAKFKRLMEDRKRDVEHWKDKLSDAKRESYSDQQEHENKIRHYEKMVSDYQSLYEEAEAEYRKHLYGQ